MRLTTSFHGNLSSIEYNQPDINSSRSSRMCLQRNLVCCCTSSQGVHEYQENKLLVANPQRTSNEYLEVHQTLHIEYGLQILDAVCTTERIWQNEFVDITALLPEGLSQPTDDHRDSQETRGKRPHCKVSSILQWVECFHTHISIAILQPHSRAADLLGYASLIVHAAWKFTGDGWEQYDRKGRQWLTQQNHGPIL